MLDAKALQGSEIVAIAEFRKQILQDPPIAIAGVVPVGALEMIFQILLYSVVVEQRVIDIEQEDDRMRLCHSELRRPSTVAAGHKLTPIITA